MRGFPVCSDVSPFAAGGILGRKSTADWQLRGEREIMGFTVDAVFLFDSTQERSVAARGCDKKRGGHGSQGAQRDGRRRFQEQRKFEKEEQRGCGKSGGK